MDVPWRRIDPNLTFTQSEAPMREPSMREIERERDLPRVDALIKYLEAAKGEMEALGRHTQREQFACGSPSMRDLDDILMRAYALRGYLI